MRLMITLISLFFSMLLSLPAIAEDVALKTKLAIDGQGNAIRDAVIVIRDGKIVSVQPNGRVPAGTRAVDLTPFTVMPGMIDLHVHIAAHFDESNRERPSITAFWA